MRSLRNRLPRDAGAGGAACSLGGTEAAAVGESVDGILIIVLTALQHSMPSSAAGGERTYEAACPNETIPPANHTNSPPTQARRRKARRHLRSGGTTNCTTIAPIRAPRQIGSNPSAGGTAAARSTNCPAARVGLTFAIWRRTGSATSTSDRNQNRPLRRKPASPPPCSTRGSSIAARV